jgi:hypothetical protein
MKNYIDKVINTEEDINSNIIKQVTNTPDFPNFHQLEMFISGSKENGAFIFKIYIMADGSSIEVAKRTYVKENCTDVDVSILTEALSSIAESNITTITKAMRGVENPPIHTLKIYINSAPYKEVCLLDE